MKTTDIMQQFMLRLKNASPEAWDGLVESFDVYATEVVIETANAPADQVLVHQGRARQCLALLRIMRECHLTKAPPTPQAQP
jgi:hypothetical protein